MKCFSPYFTGYAGSVVGFPCGRCLSCRANKSAEWALRLQFEAKEYKDFCFVTLTYAPEFLPENYSLVPSHLSGFVKRLRRALEYKGVTYKIRYFGCGEYGERRGRPHYHLFIFGLKQEDFDCVYKSWKFGRIDCQVPMDSGNASQYVAGYVSKKQPKAFYGVDRTPPFSRQSKGLGWSYVSKFPCFTQVVQNGKFTRYIGRYLRNKLAEKFGVLEEVKKKGLELLVAEMRDFGHIFLEKYDWFSDAYDISPIKAYKNAWSLFFSGALEHQLALNKLKIRGDL